MKLKLCAGFCLLLCFHAMSLFAQDQLHVTSVGRLGGLVGQRLDAAYMQRIMGQEVEELVEPFRHRNETSQWQSEFWGKWLTSAVLAYRYRPTTELKDKLRQAVEELIATQTPDGYIGNYKKEALLQQWDIWGRKYCMLGLLDYFNLTGDRKSLNAAAALADNLMDDLAQSDGKIVTKGNYRGMAASSVLEPLYLLYRATSRQKYLDFAKEIVRQWETPDGPLLISLSGKDVASRFPKPASWYSFEQGQKAYEMMSCYEGLLELYRLTGEESYKSAVERSWQNIYDTEINVAGSGASTEMWFGGKALQTMPIHHNQETCVTVTWLKLTHQLLRLTGDSKYADAGECSFYNALLGSMSPDGKEWAKYTPLSGHRLPGSGQCGMHLNCCIASGPRGLFNFPAFMVMGSTDGISVNYYNEGSYQLNTPQGRKLVLHQETRYPDEGKIRLRLEMTKPEAFSLRLRLPGWSSRNAIHVNGQEVGNLHPGTYKSIHREWKSGDVVVLELDMRGRIQYQGEQPRYAAIMRGPVLLSREQGLPGPDMGAYIDVLSKDGYVDLQPVAHDAQDHWLQFRCQYLPESYTEFGPAPASVDFCDYASAGYGPGADFFMTWLPQITDPRKAK